MKLLSYILPIYNVEQYIAQCLDSIYAQSLSDDDFEVICVDDCSPDHSMDIVKQYQSVHDNIIIVNHPVNKKAGGARNSGLRAAGGRYIWFVDPDDTIVPNSAVHLLNRMVNERLDILSFNIYKQYDDKRIEDTAFEKEVTACNGVEFLNKVFGALLIYNLGYPVRSIYSRELLLKNGIVFPEHMLYGEDTTFMAEAISKASRVACITDYLYNYRQNTNSSSAQLFQKMKGNLIFESCIVAGDMVVRLSDDLFELSSELASNLRQGILWFGNRMFVRLVKTSPAERDAFYRMLNKNQYDDEIQNHPIYAYLNSINRFVITYPTCAKVVLNILSVMYNIRHHGEK